MTDDYGILRLLSDCPTGAVSLEWLERAYEVQLAICDTLEEIADSLPANVDPRKCLDVARVLLPLVMDVHRYEEDTLFPTVTAPDGEETLTASLTRLRFEHVEDECFAEELTDTLNRLGRDDRTVNAEAAGYMLRGFFESIRRHIAFERQFVLKGTAPAP